MAQEIAKNCVCPCGQETSFVVCYRGEGSITYCRRCGLMARNPLPTKEELDHGYRDEYWINFREELLGSARENLFTHTLVCIEDLLPQRGAIVDVGCGAGAFLACCTKAGWKAIGFDPSPKAVANAQFLGLDASVLVWPPCFLEDESVDAVTFINVLDHLLDPFAALQEACRILRPGGVLYIRVPNAPLHRRLKSVLVKVGLGHLPVFHLYGFGKDSFRYHLPRLGFCGMRVYTAPLTQGNAYAATGNLGLGIKRGIKWADRMVHRFFQDFGVTILPWGLSLEVLAYKASGGPTGSENILAVTRSLGPR